MLSIALFDHWIVIISKVEHIKTNCKEVIRGKPHFKNHKEACQVFVWRPPVLCITHSVSLPLLIALQCRSGNCWITWGRLNCFYSSASFATMGRVGFKWSVIQWWCLVEKYVTKCTMCEYAIILIFYSIPTVQKNSKNCIKKNCILHQSVRTDKILKVAGHLIFNASLELLFSYSLF